MLQAQAHYYTKRALKRKVVMMTVLVVTGDVEDTSTSPVTTKAVNLPTLPFLWGVLVDSA